MHAKPPTGFREAIQLLGSALELRHAKPKQVGNGPCKDVIHRFDSTASPEEIASTPLPTLNLPIQQCWPDDGGRFITLPCVVTQDPTPARAISVCTECRSLTTKPPACIGNSKSCRPTWTTLLRKRGTDAGHAFSGRRPCIRFAPPLRCPTDLMNCCWPATSAASPCHS